MVPSAVNNLVTKFFTEEEHAEHHPDGNYTQYWHSPFDELEDFAEFLDVAGTFFY